MISEVFMQLKKNAEDALLTQGAFVRLDRGEALFVSDAPRRGVSECTALDAQFEVTQKDYLLFLTPRLSFVPARLRGAYLKMLKAPSAERERIIRQTLAECLRLKNAEEIAFMDKLYKEEIP